MLRRMLFMGLGTLQTKAYCAVIYLVLEVSGYFFPVLLSSKNQSDTADKTVYS